ncbi:MAG: serine hydrolase domain-containing protein [Crocinitomicaceae bacterium]
MKSIKSNLFFICLLCFHTSQTFGQNTSLKEQLQNFVVVYNSGDNEQLSNFIEMHFDKGIDVDIETKRWLRWRQIYGKLEHKIPLIETANKYRAFYRGLDTKVWVELTLNKSRKSTERIRNIAVGSGLKPDKFTVEHLTSIEDLPKLADAYLQNMTSKNLFSGSVFVKKGNNVLFQKAYGFANRSYQVKNTLETTFNLGSITKLFTATAIFQLIDKGKLKLEDSLHKVLPQIPDSISKGITIKQLLTHTSGLGRGEYDKSLFPFEDMSVNELLPLVYAESEFPPGTDVRYSNGAFIILGAIIEKLSRQDYFTYIVENIFDKANMKTSGFYAVDEEVIKAESYTLGRFHDFNNVASYEDGKRRSAIYLNGYRGSPAGMSYSSVIDLSNYFNALFGNKLMSNKTSEIFINEQVEIPKESESNIKNFYGFAWEIDKINGYKVIRKDGGTWGVSTRMAYIPKDDIQIIVLSNYESIGFIAADYLTDLIVKNGL